MEKKLWFVFCKGDLMLERQEDGGYGIPFAEEPPVETKPWTTVHTITPFPDGTPVRTYAIDMPVIDHSRYEMSPLRQSYQNTKFCGVCGAPMKLHTEISKRCTECGKEVWPQLATAIIVLIRREDKVLLVHARNFRSDFYGLVAGFVETGESLEEAVVREVREETGLEIANIRYFGSQPWPYPCGLMVGFFADYAGGEIHLQKSELSAGGWFTKDNLPHIPEKLSIARRLIDTWLEE